jgi:hypothetical protein
VPDQSNNRLVFIVGCNNVESTPISIYTPYILDIYTRRTLTNPATPSAKFRPLCPIIGMVAPLDVAGTLPVTDAVAVPFVGVLELVVLWALVVLGVLVGLGKDIDVLLVVNAKISVELLLPITSTVKLLLRKYQGESTVGKYPLARPPIYTPNQKLANSSPATESASLSMRSGIYHTTSLISKPVVFWLSGPAH